MQEYRFVYDVITVVIISENLAGILLGGVWSAMLLLSGWGA